MLFRYPDSFEEKVGFDEIRRMLTSTCSGPLGQDEVVKMKAETDADTIKTRLEETAEMKLILEGESELPSLSFDDIRPALSRIRPEGTWLDEQELYTVGGCLRAITALYRFFCVKGDEATTTSNEGSKLSALLAHIELLPKVESNITRLFNQHRRIADGASSELQRIRRQKTEVERSVSHSIDRILKRAQNEGWAEVDARPAIRDGRLTIPVSPAFKRSIPGIIQGESATGRTVFIEPTEIVEASNRSRELEAEEHREIIRILVEATTNIRPFIPNISECIRLIGLFDFIVAKARFAIRFGGDMPQLTAKPEIQWLQAKHPVLMKSLAEHGRQIVPLDISLKAPNERILLISGPNAGGKSVCLKTVGLIQYMVQAGMLPTISPDSTVGVFESIAIDIGDEQSLEDDLSTYSSHLRNMKQFARMGSNQSLLLIDEFGSGTEPHIGGAIAEALISLFNEKKSYGVITTHYHNLKVLAEETPGLINGAMLYDRHEMKPLFQLSIGRPGSSFAIEIARKTGLPEKVIAQATEIVGQDYIDMDKYLQDIVRDKRYWEEKRKTVRRQEKQLEDVSTNYQTRLLELDKERKQIILEAREEAQRLVDEARSRIEGTIRSIKEAEAERERTRSLRAELAEFREHIAQDTAEREAKRNDKYKRELERLERRQASKAKKQAKGKTEVNTSSATKNNPPTEAKPFAVNDMVQVDGQVATGRILSLSEREAVIALGNLKTTVPLKRLRQASTKEVVEASKQLEKIKDNRRGGSNSIIDHLYSKRLEFDTEIDLRGMRATEAVTATSYFIDTALQLGVSRVRILHGTGSGALREAIRDYLSGITGIANYHDEHVQLGGSGITVVDFE